MTDALAAGESVEQVPLRDGGMPGSSGSTGYAVAATTDGDGPVALADAFVAFVTSEEARSVLRKQGFT